MCDCCDRFSAGSAGWFDFSCLECCVRLLKTGRPNRKIQESMLLTIGRWSNAKTKTEILETLKNG
jgi:hypothetical protein